MNLKMVELLLECRLLAPGNSGRQRHTTMDRGIVRHINRVTPIIKFSLIHKVIIKVDIFPDAQGNNSG